jgi:DNA modification methylase
MEVKKVKLSALKLNDGNPRIIKDFKFHQLVKSLLTFPEMLRLREVVCDETMLILGGNMRCRALMHIAQMTEQELKQELKKIDRDEYTDQWMRWHDCPMIDVKIAEGLSDEQKKEFIVKDNVGYGEWDWDMLANEWDMEDLKDWGVDIPVDWGNDAESKEMEKEAEEDDFDEEKDAVEPICQHGDIWMLGQHTLMCGDSTKAEDFERLMDGQKADLTFTSPPYNAGCLDIKGRNSTKKKYMNDEDTKTDEQYLSFLSSNVNLLLKHSDEVFYNIGVVAGSKIAILGLLYEYREKFKDFIYWKKNNPVNYIAKGVISSAVELIMCFGDNNTRSFKDTHFSNGEYYLGVIEGNVASNNEYSKIHKATFPIYLPENIIKNFSSKGSSIIDCFGGTGTTLIACEQLDRKCYMMELDPHYCDVIIARWEKLTGNKAIKKQ